MFATIAAIAFGLALLLDLTGTSFDVITGSTLVTVGLLFLALHFMPSGGGKRWRR